MRCKERRYLLRPVHIHTVTFELGLLSFEADGQAGLMGSQLNSVPHQA
jgi:hypothetical protein